MKQILMVIGVLISAQFASASVSTCSDPRLMVRFATQASAYNYCARLNNHNVEVGVTYDHGYKAFTCSCYQKDNGGSNN